MTNSNKANTAILEAGLLCKYTNRKSFYDKAKVYLMSDGALVLKSYDTIVAVYRNHSLKVRDYYSVTTSNHIREFARQVLGNRFTEDVLKTYTDDDPVFQYGVFLD